MVNTRTRPQEWTSWVVVVIVLLLVIGVFLLASRYLMTP